MSEKNQKDLALFGGSPVRQHPLPSRGMIGKEEKAAVDALFDRAISTGESIVYNGPEEEAYCKEFAAYMGGGWADAVNSGSTAVYVALRSLNIEPFSEIIVSPITDPGGMMPILMLNCIPVVADAAPGSYNTNAASIEKMITPHTGAILVAHIGGEPADIENIVALGKKHGIPVVEDCAQAHHAKLGGKLLGTFGDVAAFSTMFGKHHCTGGQGGLVYTKNEDTYWNIRRAADRGKPFNLPAGSTNSFASLNFNSSELSAVVGRVQLKKLPGFVEKRQAIVARLTEGFKGLKSVSVPPLLQGAEHSYWWWRLKFNEGSVSCSKQTFCDALAREGLPLITEYAAMPHLMDWFQNKHAFGTSQYPWSAPEYKGNRNQAFPCPNACAAIKEHFILYVYESWSNADIQDILTIFNKVEAAFLP